MRLDELASIAGGELRGDPGLEVTGASGLAGAAEGDVSFIAGRKQLEEAKNCSASCLLVGEFYEELSCAQLKVDDPQMVFASLLERLHPRRRPGPGVHPEAHVDKGARLSEGVSIGACAVVSEGAQVGESTVIYPGAYLGRGVSVGRDCTIYPNVSLLDGVSIGDRVSIHAGSVVGSDGFGYLQREGRHVKVPQVGTVRVEDDVEIGACVCIDRATTGETVVGRGSKLDNLVQIAHNVEMGEHVVMAAQSGVAGSSRLGDHVMAGGGVSISDHLEIKDGVMLAGRAGVIGDLEKGVYAGVPAVPHRQWLKVSALILKLPELFRRLLEVEKKLGVSEDGEDK
jgi:UDP-3-O-[3-hydroxymyristoyl] glucosamine N-acyltransferase